MPANHFALRAGETFFEAVAETVFRRYEHVWKAGTLYVRLGVEIPRFWGSVDFRRRLVLRSRFSAAGTAPGKRRQPGEWRNGKTDAQDTCLGRSVTVRHEPRRRLRNADVAMQLHGRNRLQACEERMDGDGPLAERDLRPMHGGPRPDAEAGSAIRAPTGHPGVTGFPPLQGTAFCAVPALRPDPALEPERRDTRHWRCPVGTRPAGGPVPRRKSGR